MPSNKAAVSVLILAVLAPFSLVLTGCPGPGTLPGPVTIVMLPTHVPVTPSPTPNPHAFINVNVCLPDAPYAGCNQPTIDILLNGTDVFGAPVWSGAAEPEILSGPNTMVFTLVYDSCNPTYYFTVNGTLSYTDVFTASAGTTYNVSTGGVCPFSSVGPITLTYP